MSFGPHSEETKRKISEAKKGIPSWNKGLKIGLTHPSMGFQKNHKFSNNSKSIATRFKKGQHSSDKSEFKKGIPSWNKGIEWMEMRGSNNPAWISDRNLVKMNEKKHLDSAYQFWMISVKRRDNWKCKIGNEDCRGRLESHHILTWKDHPKLRYDINNGITLCLAHHPRRRAEEKRLAPFFQGLVPVSN